MDTVDSASASQTVRYPGLVERAIECIESHHGAIPEDALIAHVFGSGAGTSVWRPLLRGVLQDHPGLTLRPDGVWTTGAAHAGDEFPEEFVVLDIETTGLKPSQQRIIEVGLIRVSSSGSPLRWSSLINPGRPIPRYIASLTGIDDQLVSTAPEFRAIAPTIVETIADLPVVGHNVDFDVAFLNAELMRCGLPSLVNPAVDTLALANTFAPESRRLNLVDIARTVGVNTAGAHRAMRDAEMTLEVFRSLMGRASERGVRSMDDILRACAANKPRRVTRTSVGRGRSILDRSLLDDVPNAPGVYIMRDSADRVLYVGKAKDLRKRVSSYYSQPLGYTRKMDGLLESLARVECEVVGSELEALILESQLIRRYRPRFNTVQRNVEQYAYVRVDVSNRWPRVTNCRDRADDGALYFGPFKSASRAKEAVAVVNDILPLRTCRRSFADVRSYGNPCLELSLNRCLGPCMGLADSDEYRGLVQDVIGFFRGDAARLVSHLHTKLERTTETLNFERAARLRDQLRKVESLAHEQARIDDAAQHRHAVLVLPSASPNCREVWYLLRGQRWAQLRVDNGDSVEDVTLRLDVIRSRAVAFAETVVPNHHAVDEMSILARWMRRTPRHPALISLDEDPPTSSVARAILDVDLTRPFGEPEHERDGEDEDDASTH